MTFCIGVVGDLHTHWDDIDVAHFDRSDYDMLFFIGDLGGGTPESTTRIARVMSKLRKPALVMPGNNDTGDMEELAAELTHRSGIRRLNAIGRGVSADPTIRLCGFSIHRVTTETVDFSLIAGRPHSMGGSDLSFPDYMMRTYGIDSIAAAAERLCALVDQAETRDLLFFSHNGPTGLGAEPADMWGCDFMEGGGDWGDPDLAAAISYAQNRGHRIRAVVAGHMHLRTKDGFERPWLTELEGVLYVNTARVPRIFAREDDVFRHHVALEINHERIDVVEQLVR